MKKLFILLTALSVLVSCNKDNEVSYPITGTWELVSVETKSAVIGSTSINVVLTLSEDNSFTLEQTVGEGRSTSYSGTYSYLDGLLSGKYSDGTSWGDSYTVTLTETTMSLTSSSGKETDTYRRQ